MSPEDMIMQILRRHSDTGITILWYKLCQEGADLSKDQVAAIVDRLVIERKIQEIQRPKHGSLYALVATPRPQRTAKARVQAPKTPIASLKAQLSDKKAKRVKALQKAADLEQEILALESRIEALKRANEERRETLKNLRKEAKRYPTDRGNGEGVA